MHGNFNESVTTFISTDTMSSEEHEQSREPRTESDVDEDLQTVKVEMDVSIPSLEVELLKLKLDSSSGKVGNQAVFEMWVTFTMLGMTMWMEQRTYDQLIKTQINKMSLIDETMIINKRLMTQTVNTARTTRHSKDQ